MAKFSMTVGRSLSGKAVNLSPKQLHAVAHLIATVACHHSPPRLCDNYNLELFGWATSDKFGVGLYASKVVMASACWYTERDWPVKVEVCNAKDIDDHIVLTFHRFAEDNADGATECVWQVSNKYPSHPVTTAANTLEHLLGKG